jgi:hypothetical protein
MRRSLVLHIAIARRVVAQCLFFMATSGVAFAQITGTVNPNPAAAEPPAKEDVPPGSCMPIGLTVSGEIVFPIQCKEFIEREREKTAERSAAVAGEKPVAKQSEVVAPSEAVVLENGKAADKPSDKPADKPADKLADKPADKLADKPLEPASSRRIEHQARMRTISSRAAGSDDCTHYRTYDPSSGTYRGYDGRVRSCR